MTRPDMGGTYFHMHLCNCIDAVVITHNPLAYLLDWR